MRWLALQVCDENSKRVPIFVELKGLSQKSFASADVRLESVLFDHAAESLKKLGATESHREQLREEFARRLKSGEIVALLDGLDEVRGWEHFHHLCEAINFKQNDEAAAMRRQDFLAERSLPHSQHGLILGAAQAKVDSTIWRPSRGGKSSRRSKA